MRFLAPAGALLVFAVACSEPLEFADWTIEVPEGTRVIDYAPVTTEEREGNHIELVEDLVIRSRGEDERYLMYQPRDIDVGPEGNIYVLDTGYFHVKVFDAHGEHIRTFGSRGEGPAELARPRAAAVVGDRFVVNDTGRRLSIWTLDGEFVGTRAMPVQAAGTGFQAFDEDSVAIRYLTGMGDGSMVDAAREGTLRLVTGRMFLEQRAIEEIVSVPETVTLLGPGVTSLASGYRAATVLSTTGDVYFTKGDEYQLMSWSSTGAPRWAVRVAHPRTPHTEEEIEAVLEEHRERYPEVSRAQLEIAASAPSLSTLLVDGRGRLYVFLYKFVAGPLQETAYPVDVYLPDGERLYSGYMPRAFWRASSGDHLYTFVYDPERDEQTLVRYRIVEPFE